mgnify:CR=1 FL=1
MGVVEAVDILKERLRDLGMRRPSVPPDEFGFQSFEEGLECSIFVTVNLSTHRYCEALDQFLAK